MLNINEPQQPQGQQPQQGQAQQGQAQGQQPQSQPQGQFTAEQIFQQNQQGQHIGAQPNTAYFQQQQQPQQEVAGAFGYTGAFSFANSAGWGRPIAFGTNSEYLHKLAESISKHLKGVSASNNDMAFEMKVIVMDKAAYTTLAYSTIVLAIKTPAINAVSFIPLLIENTGAPLSSYEVDVHNTKVKIDRTADDAFDSDLIAICNERITKEFPGLNKIPVEAIVVPRHVQHDDDFVIPNMTAMAFSAIGIRLLSSAENFVDLNLVRNIGDTHLEIVANYTKGAQVADVFKNPIATDMQLVFAAKPAGKENSKRPNGGESQSPVSQLQILTDFIYSPHPESIQASGYMQMPGMINPMNPNAYRKFFPHFIITDMDLRYGWTPACVLFGLAPIEVLQQPDIWMNAFRNTGMNNNLIDTKDIGALNFEGAMPAPGEPPSEFGRRIDTKKDPSFSHQAFIQYLSTVCYSKPIVSIDCPETGPMAAILAYIAAASNSSHVHHTNRLMRGMNALTNMNAGNVILERQYQGKPLFLNPNNRIFLGTYRNANGEKRDIREIDNYLAFANIVGDKNPALIRQFTDTYNAVNVPLEVRLARRKSLLREVTGDTLEVTGYAQRITPSAVFWDILFGGIKRTNTTVKLVTPGSIDIQQRGIPQWATNAQMSGQQAFTYYVSGNHSQNPYRNGGFWTM